jgi:ribonuclease HI
MKIKCYTDGSCISSGKYGDIAIGAWAYKIVIKENTNIVNWGKETGTTSILMEIEAVKQLLLELNDIILKYKRYNPTIIIYSDCRGLISKINDSLNKESYKSKGKYKESYVEIVNLVRSIEVNKISFKWIKGHNTNDKEKVTENNIDIDALARTVARRFVKELSMNNTKIIL